MTRIEATELADALKGLAKYCPTNPSIPILSHVLIETKKGGASLTATTLDAVGRRDLTAKGGKAGSFAVSLRLLSAFCERAHGEVTLSHDDEARRLNLKAGRKSARIPTLPGEDFPKLEYKGGEEVKNPAALAEAMRFCMPAMSSNDTRYYLCGVHVGADRVSGTDGNALHVIRGDFGGDAIIPAAAAPLMVDAMTREGARAWISETFWRVDSGGRHAAGKLIEGSYPDVERIIPTDAAPVLECARKDMIDAARSAVLFAGAAVEIATDGVAALISSRGGDNLGYENSEVALDCATHRDGAWIKLNSKYLDEALCAMPDGIVTISQTATGDPMTITSKENPNALAVIMPMRK